MAQIEIATSFSKKINLAAYGGNQYESEDCFVSCKETIDIEENKDLTPRAQIEANIKGLNQVCQDMVESILKERILKLKR